MQFKFVATFFLVGVCLAQVSLAQLNIVGDLLKRAKTVNDNLTFVMTETIRVALEDLDQLKNQVTSLAQEAITSTEERLNLVISDAGIQIQAIGDNISPCIATSEDQFKQLLQDFLNAEIQCVQKEIDSALQIIDESIAIVIEVRDVVEALPGRLSNCGSRLTSIGCINGVILETANLEAQLPLKIAAQVAEATTYVAGLKIRLEVCATTQLAAAGIEAAKIVAQVGQCAAEAIGENIEI